MTQVDRPTRGTASERCACGNQVARLSPDGIEILCRRCKRIHRIPWNQVKEAPLTPPAK